MQIRVISDKYVHIEALEQSRDSIKINYISYNKKNKEIIDRTSNVLNTATVAVFVLFCYRHLRLCIFIYCIRTTACTIQISLVWMLL